MPFTRRTLLLAAAAAPCLAGEPRPDYRREADGLTRRTQALFWDPGPAMYRAPVMGPEAVPSEGDHDRGYVLWPSIEMLHALVEGELARKGRYRAAIAEVYAGLEKYRHAEAHAYNAWLDFPGNIDRYYDDNAIVARVLAKAARATGDRRYRDRAVDVLEGFVRQGWDADGDPGGMQWGVDPTKGGTGDRAACSTNMAALAALELASQGVDRSRNIQWARDLMSWLMTRLLDANGLVCDGLEPPDWKVRRTTWTYNTGMAIQVHVQLARLTGEATYLEAARRMGDAAINRSGGLYDGLVKDPYHSYWFDSGFFVAYLADGLADLSRATRDRRYRDEVLRNAAFALRYLMDPADGLSYRNWRLWRIDQAHRDTWARMTGLTHPLEADDGERASAPNGRPAGERPVVKTLLANAGQARFYWICARA